MPVKYDKDQIERYAQDADMIDKSKDSDLKLTEIQAKLAHEFVSGQLKIELDEEQRYHYWLKYYFDIEFVFESFDEV